MTSRVLMRPLIFAATVLRAASITAQVPTMRPNAADSLLDHLVGKWTMVGQVRGKAVTYHLDAARTLRGRYVELHMVDAAPQSDYEARVVIGVDTTGRGFVAHWMDSFGASYSVPAGAGPLLPNAIQFSIPYPTGTFRDTFAFDPKAGTWHFRLEAFTNGRWSDFATYDVRR